MGYWDKKEPKKEAKTEEKKPDSVSLEELEESCREELGEVEKSFRARMDAENKRFRDMCDTEYWCCVCFTSRAQKEEFLKSLGLDPLDKYIDGKEMARAMKRPIRTQDLKFAQIGKGGKEYSAIAMDDD